jgi:hypothetical protein
MCNVDTGVLGQVWVDPQEPMAFPDFNTQHLCKNYDVIKQWAEKLQVRDLRPPCQEVNLAKMNLLRRLRLMRFRMIILLLRHHGM